MIQKNTIIKVADNSGAKTARCIQVLGGFKKKFAKLGDTIVVSIQQLRNKAKTLSKVKKKEVYRALVIKTKTKITKKNGFSTLFFENSIILFNKQGNSIGTRIPGPLPRALKKKKFQKITSISAGLV